MTLPEDMDPIGRRLRALEKEVASLRGRNPLASATLDDEDGNRRINFGRLPDGGFGVEVFDESGVRQFRVDANGMRSPYLPLHKHDADDGYSYVSGTWIDTRWWLLADTISHEGFKVTMAGYTEAGTTGQLRLSIPATGQFSAPHTYSAADDFQVHSFQWLHGLPSGFGPYQIRVQARRTVGTGNFYVYDPNGAAQVDGAICTPSGT